MEKVLIYGMGDFFEKHNEEIGMKYDVVGYVDRKAKNIRTDNFYSSIKEINDIIYDKIVIMVSRTRLIFEIIKLLLQEGIRASDIILGINEWGDYANKIQIYVNDDGQIVVKKDDIFVTTWTEDEFVNTMDVMLNECYKYYIPSNKEQVVFDVGMNIGDSAIYFANKPEVVAVYGFEPFKKTYEKALININNQRKKHVIKALNYGLSDVDCEIEIPYADEMTCGQSTILNNTEKARENYEKWDLLLEKKCEYEKIINKKSSDIIEKIMKKYNNADFVLKMDCEGEEYNIFRDMSSSGIIQGFSLIMLEWHYHSDKSLINILKENKFAYVSVQKSISPDFGLIYAWKK